MRLIITMFFTLFLGCNRQSIKTSSINTVDKSHKLQPKTIEAPVQQFAFSLLHTQQDDFLLSPISIFASLFMAGSGAKEETYDEFNALLFPDYKLSLEKKVEGFSKISRMLENEKELNFYTSLWAQKGFDINPQYKDLLKDYFAIDIENVDFSIDQTRKMINDDVSNKTNQRITELLPAGSLDNLTRLVIINTIHFLDHWKSPFDKKRTRQAPFSSYGVIKKIPYMFKKLTIPVFLSNELTYIEIPYHNSRFTMQIFMGAKGKEMAFFKQFSSEQYYRIQSEAKKKQVIVQLPKWENKFKINLNQTLQSLGLKRAFDENLAQFFKISLKKRLYITDVFHQAYIKVDEQGTETSAATAVVMGIKSISMPQRVAINRPFLYTIYDNKTKMILFMGVQSFKNVKE